MQRGVSLGYAATLRGLVLVKTVSERPLGAVVNALALEFDEWVPAGVSEEEVLARWAALSEPRPEYQIVAVECRQIGEALTSFPREET